jgi:hypothetical protein
VFSPFVLSLSKDNWLTGAAIVSLSKRDMSFWVYILRCSDNSYYTGHTDDLEKRLAEHQTGQLKGYTENRHP